MKEFVLTQPYATIEEMINSGEVAVYMEELKQGDIDMYAIVSRIGNRYDLKGNKIDFIANNPFYCNEEKNTEGYSMKYGEIEMLIEKEIEKAVADVNEKYEAELTALKEAHEKEIAVVKENVKAELIAKINS